MAITTKEQLLQKELRGKVRIKKCLDHSDDVVYRVQVKKWYGWTDVLTDRFLFFTFPKEFYTYDGALIEARRVLNQLYNKVVKKYPEYFYYPF